MGGYRKTSHSVYDIKYHVVWITKYRKPVLSKDVGRRLRELIRQVCTGMDIQIIKGHVSRDHVHMMVSVPPYISVSDMMKRIKRRTSYNQMNEYRGLKKAFWGQHLWARGCFAASTGNVTDEVIKIDIEAQSKMERDKDEEFKVDK